MSLADENSVFVFVFFLILSLIELAHHLKLILITLMIALRFMPLQTVHLHAVSYSWLLSPEFSTECQTHSSPYGRHIDISASICSKLVSLIFFIEI